MRRMKLSKTEHSPITSNLIQLMVTGVSGSHGMSALRHVEVTVYTEERDPANVHHQLLVVTCVSVTLSRKSSVLWTPVPVSIHAIPMLGLDLSPSALAMTYLISVAVDCVVSEWTGWGDCSVTCGAGLQYATREVIQEPLFNGADCPVLHKSQQCVQENCTGIYHNYDTFILSL